LKIDVWGIDLDKFNLVKDSTLSGNVEDIVQNLTDPVRQVYFAIGSFAMSLGTNVIKDNRPHRVVYAKSIVFRSFLDVKPHADHLEVKVIKGRNFEPEIFKIKNVQELKEIKIKIKDAYAIVS
jgi:hypothetical protein